MRAHVAEAFLQQDSTGQRKVLSKMETMALLDEIESTFRDSSPAAHLRMVHRWESGDFIIADNLAIGHEASSDTQRPPEQIGLRVMHRCTIAGTTVPEK